MHETEKIWMNGELVGWQDAKVHVLSHVMHYGSGVFEGIRAYSTDRGPAVFRLMDHLRRLERSSEIYFMDLPYSIEELRAATHEVIAVNGLDACYVRPLAYRGYGELGINPLTCPVDVIIAVWPWGAYLGEEALEHGVRVMTSSWRRIGPNTLPAAAKASGQYLNSQLAKMEAMHAGYDEAILLNEQGYLADGSGENVFMVQDGVLASAERRELLLEVACVRAEPEDAGAQRSQDVLLLLRPDVGPREGYLARRLDVHALAGVAAG